MRLIQHKKEAFWFYRFVSIGYDNFINPFFWTVSMREKALELAQYAIAGVKPVAGESSLRLDSTKEDVTEPMTVSRFLSFVFRFVVNSAAGALFIPIAMYQSLRFKGKG